MGYLTREPINILGVVGATRRVAPTTGASVLFLGLVRDHSRGKKVLYLEYEAYESMAERVLERLVTESVRRWPVESVHLQHRLGRVDLGEIAVAIHVQSAHRRAAYEASRYLIEGIKAKVPIWKKEYFADGTSEWSGCDDVHLRAGPRAGSQTFESVEAGVSRSC